MIPVEEIKTAASQITVDAITISTTTIAINLTKREKRPSTNGKKPPVPARKFRELPEVLEYTEGMNVADIAKNLS